MVFFAVGLWMRARFSDIGDAALVNGEHLPYNTALVGDSETSTRKDLCYGIYFLSLSLSQGIMR